MQYLHLVYLSEQMLKAMQHGERRDCAAPLRCLAMEGFRFESTGIFDRRCSDGLVTDGPFVETKEYRTGS